jgi:acyl-coenzyme A thioesterase PaaI-like protein
MDVTAIPFNRLLGIKRAPGDSTCLLELDQSPSLVNHLGTVHASAQLALGEAASGEHLLRSLPEYRDQVLAVVRRVEAKFRNPMKRKIFARAVTPEAELRQTAGALATKSRAMFPVCIEIVDSDGTVGLAATFEWFVQKLTALRPEA